MEQSFIPANPQAQIIQQNKRIAELENTVAELSALVKHFEELFKISQNKRFGISSEKTVFDSAQMSIFGDAEVVPPVLSEQEETEDVTFSRKKRKGKRQEDLSKLPLEVVEHELPEEDRKCPECGETMSEIGAEIRDEIKIVPARVIHVRHRYPTYKCLPCDKNTGETPILKTPMPEPVIKGSVASASAIAYVMTQKHLMHLPFYRLEQDFMRQGVFINRQNMVNWSIQVSENYLGLIYDKLGEKLLMHDVIHSDETTLQVLREPGKAAQSKSYMWQYRTSGDSGTPVVFYEYQPDRGGEHPENFLKGWRGFLHTDGYAGYRGVDGATIVGCWAHVRRKFDEAFKIAKAEDSPAAIGRDFCNRLFSLERKFTDMPPEERYEARNTQSKPIAEAFFAWAESVNVPPKLAISRAITYALNQRAYLMNFFLDGRLELSNNRAERSIKPFVMGRKNWLFCNSVNGAKASAIAFSIIETAKENGLKPFEYLRHLFETLPSVTIGQVEMLLPWSDHLPPECRMDG